MELKGTGMGMKRDNVREIHREEARETKNGVPNNRSESNAGQLRAANPDYHRAEKCESPESEKEDDGHL
ncbi:hypothetical protein HPP92_019139 [Vanilla planifolia]|uniref:Uncharacterized protein n=1 Tax=Vanilla planifolia TaxID=51239 RepID=A0A835ULF6_VANPL|nr:hypothetical protein HPP92_019139 [Vanilla planifolia]